jgi:hypothetical protein
MQAFAQELGTTRGVSRLLSGLPRLYLLTVNHFNITTMKRLTKYLLLLSILTLGCGEEDGTENVPPDATSELQNLKDGEFVIKLYNTNGDLLLTKKGDAENLGTAYDHWEIRLLDPSFGTQDSDPLQTFASLTISGQSGINTPRQLQFNKDNAASFHQRWYSLEDDWGYKSSTGTLVITSVEKLKITGSFEISLEVDVNARQNPLWGEYILAKGYFSSTCPYENAGGCPL